MHSRYKEWCALASTGQLDPADQPAFAGHLRGCRSCREMLRDLGELQHSLIPTLAAQRALSADVDVPANLRSRFLERLGNSDLEHFDPSPLPAPKPSARARVQSTDDPRTLLHRLFAPRIIATAAGCLVFGLSGYLIARDRTPRTVAVTPVVVPEKRVSAPPPQPATPVPTVKQAPSDPELSALKEQLESSEAKNLELKSRLQVFTSQSAS